MTTVALTQNQPVNTNGIERGVAVVQLRHTDCTEAALTQTWTLAALAAAHPNNASTVPANAIIHRVSVRRIADFAGGAVATATIEIGDAADIDELCTSINVFTGAKAAAAVSQGNTTYTSLAAAGTQTFGRQLGRVIVIGATADRLSYLHRGAPVVITLIDSVINKALTTANATLTASINTTAITGGVLTLTQAGSAAGDIDTASPTAARTMVDGDVLKVVCSGSQDAAGSVADVAVYGYQLGALEAAYAPQIKMTTTVANVSAITAGCFEISIEYTAIGTTSAVIS